MSHHKNSLRSLGGVAKTWLRSLWGVAFAMACLATAVTGRTVNGLSFDTVSPTVAASLGLTFSSIALLLYAERRTFVRIVRAASPNGERLRAPLRDVFRRVKETWRQMHRAIVLMAFGVSAMLFFMLLALLRLEQMGTVTALVFLGPLAIYVTGLWKLTAANRAFGVFWMLFALLGIVLLTRVWEGRFDWVGTFLALGAGVAYAAFLVAFEKMKKINESAIELGVALANLIGAAATVVVTLTVLGLLDGRHLEGFTNPREDWLTWHVVGIVTLAGLLSGVLTQIGQAHVFQKELVTLPTLSILTGLEPAMGALAGWAILGDRPTALDWIGIGLVCVAGSGCALLVERAKARAAGVTPGDSG